MAYMNKSMMKKMMKKGNPKRQNSGMRQGMGPDSYKEPDSKSENAYADYDPDTYLNPYHSDGKKKKKKTADQEEY